MAPQSKQQTHCQILTATIGADLSLGRLSDEVLASSGQFSAPRRWQFLTGRALLADVMFTQYGHRTLPAITLSSTGKPVFTDPTLPQFSLSHSGDLVLLALCDKGGVGCDVEHLRPRPSWPALAVALFSAKENRWLGEHKEPLEGFWTLWSLREAWLKQQGRSVWEMAAITVDPQQLEFTASVVSRGLLWSTRWQGHAVALALPEGILPPADMMPLDNWVCYRNMSPRD